MQEKNRSLELELTTTRNDEDIHKILIMNEAIGSYYDHFAIQEDGSITARSVQKALAELHDTLHMSWPQIAALPFLNKMHNSTLNYIYRTGKVSRKWRKYLGIFSEPDRIAIHKTDDLSAFMSIIHNTKPSFIMALNCRLTDWAEQRKLPILEPATIQALIDKELTVVTIEETLLSEE